MQKALPYLLLEVHDCLVDLEVVGELGVLRHLDGVHAPVVPRCERVLDHLQGAITDTSAYFDTIYSDNLDTVTLQVDQNDEFIAKRDLVTMNAWLQWFILPSPNECH